MNPVEIEHAISELAGQPFEREEFPFSFLEAFGNKATTIKRLRSKNSNKSDIESGVLQRSNIHIATCDEGLVTDTLARLKESPETKKAKVKYILATDGLTLEAEDLNTGETVASDFSDIPNHFGFFLALAGISTVKQIRNNPIDIQATGRLNRLYVELLKENEEWGAEERRHDMNHFMARLIFCFFAEDTDIFSGDDLFTNTIDEMSDSRSGNTHEVIEALFRAMDTKYDDRAEANIPRWADKFPYVNGGLFEGNKDVPKFSRMARTYLIHAGRLNWQEINPDIFGSMIQAVAEDEERGELGMHYTSVPNILKVLNPLFLDDLREQLEAAGDNGRKLLNLRKRLASIRVFDPACGSGNFLVIAYIQMREIEAEILKRRNEEDRRSWIKLENFFGIEIKDFACEVARLSLLIAEFQCDVRMIGQKEAKEFVLPLKRTGQIVCGNALRLDWLEVCPALEGDEVETYICGNPPYRGSKWQTSEQKKDLQRIFDGRTKNWKSLDYVAGWFIKAADFASKITAMCAFVSTNSICQGQQVPILWPQIFATGVKIFFAHTSFKWANLASHNAGVTVVVVGFSQKTRNSCKLFSEERDGEIIKTITQSAININAYLINGENTEVSSATNSISKLHKMQFGNHPYYAAALILSSSEREQIVQETPLAKEFILPLYGSREFISNTPRACIWISDKDLEVAKSIHTISERLDKVSQFRYAAKKDLSAQKLAKTPHRFRDRVTAKKHVIIVPRVSSENRNYLPVGLLPSKTIIHEKAFALYDAPLWNMALIASRLHWVWIGTVCVRLEMRFSYSNTLGWNTFPVPTLTEKNKADLTRCAEDILLAREAHFPATIADLYNPDTMPENLRTAHDRNDEVLERIYIGRRFKNDTERLEKLFELYTEMTSEGSGDRGQGSGNKGVEA